MSTVPYSYGSTLLKIEDVCLSYGEKVVLKGVNAEVKDIIVPGRTVGQVVGFIGPSGIGKCLGKGTPVLMFDGSIKPVEDISDGDLLMGPDSTPRVVQSTTKGHDKLYRVIPVKGASYVVNEDHILAVIDQTRPESPKMEISVRDYLMRSKWFKKQCRGYRSGCIDFNLSSVPIDPYLLGIWLGDGASEYPSICTPEPEIVNFLEGFASSNDVSITVHEGHGCANYRLHNKWRRHDAAILYAFRDLGILNNKHVPHNYKINSRDVRLQVLAGLLDTDAEYANSTNCFTLTSALKVLADDACFLARSLGLAAYCRPFIGRCKYKGEIKEGIYYRVVISGDVDIIPTKVGRKRGRKRLQRKSVLNTGITVESDGIGDYYGFELSGDGLFLLGDFTVTHNTSLCRIMAGLNSPTSGRVVLNGFDRAAEAGEVGVVAQSYPLFEHRTVLSNLMLAARRKYPSEKEAHEHVTSYLSDFDLYGEVNHYPAQLSGGQRQRCAIIQQMLAARHFVILDEPFSGLDPVMKQKAQDLIAKIANMDGLNTIIIVSHDIAAVSAVADHVWALGRDHDASGKSIPGARIVETYDLLARGLAYHSDIKATPEFIQFVSEVNERFATL